MITSASDYLPSEYLGSCTNVDVEHPLIQTQARILLEQASDQTDLARRIFEFVRDQITHSFDVQANTVTCKASDVLLQGTGVCFAKSHLAASLLRANGLPAALLYQRLFMEDINEYGLHGLNAVYLDDFGWYVFDARGNKQDVSTSFTPPEVQYAFSMGDGELLVAEYFQSPLKQVVTLLESANDMQDVDRGMIALGAVFA